MEWILKDLEGKEKDLRKIDKRIGSRIGKFGIKEDKRFDFFLFIDDFIINLFFRC